MFPRISHYDFDSFQEVVELGGDLLLLPQLSRLPYEEARALESAGVIEPNDSVIHNSVYKIFEYQGRYQSERHELGREPDWIHDMPISVRRALRQSYAMTQEDALAIMGGLPYAHISYMVREGGLCEDLFHTFKLWRLQYIRQLGFLNQPTYNHYARIRQSLSDHTRWTHSLDVMAIGTLMSHNMRLNEQQFNEVRTLCLTHDTLTPAGGDSVKMVDLAALDEDANYPAFLKTLDMQRLRKKYGIRKSVLVRGIRNEGLAGEILDIADKIAYTARDLQKCLHHIEGGAQQDQLGMKTLLYHLQNNPDVCSLWDCVELQGKRPVFTNQARLLAFLKARLLMFRELYYHPTARFGEFLMSRLFVRVLLQKGILTKETLLDLTDDTLCGLLDQHFGLGVTLDTCSSDLARVKEFKTLEEGQAFARELTDGGNVFVMIDDNRRAIKTGADLPVWTKHGPVPYRDADPGSARELSEMATMLRLVHVYYLDGDPALSRDALRSLKESLAA